MKTARNFPSKKIEDLSPGKTLSSKHYEAHFVDRQVNEFGEISKKHNNIINKLKSSLINDDSH